MMMMTNNDNFMGSEYVGKKLEFLSLLGIIMKGKGKTLVVVVVSVSERFLRCDNPPGQLGDVIFFGSSESNVFDDMVFFQVN